MVTTSGPLPQAHRGPSNADCASTVRRSRSGKRPAAVDAEFERPYPVGVVETRLIARVPASSRSRSIHRHRHHLPLNSR